MNSTTQTIDPVCGMHVDAGAPEKATWQGKTYRFCSPDCRLKFESDPDKYTAAAPRR
jgi:Cu+-exporting ATPase